MNENTTTILGIISILTLANWGTPEVSTNGSIKNKLNFYGKLITQQDQAYLVENISLGRIFKQIPMYELPKKLDRKTKKLSLNPQRDVVITKIDLAEVSEVRILHPETIWYYQKKKGYRKTEYIEIIVISNDNKKTKNSYLIELRKKLFCDKVTGKEPNKIVEEKEVPLQAIKVLKVKGYTHRDTVHKKKAV